MAGKGERAIRVSVTLRTSQGVAWSGLLWVDAQRGAMWREAVSEAPETSCARVDWSYNSVQRETSITLRRVLNDDRDEMMSVAAKWSRPGTGTCSATQTVEVSAVRALAPDQAVVIEGDGGLVVELRRR